LPTNTNTSIGAPAVNNPKHRHQPLTGVCNYFETGEVQGPIDFMLLTQRIALALLKILEGAIKPKEAGLLQT
jgi:hypothetical protein